MSERERSKSFLEQFNFKLLDSHYFEELQSSFWDSENIMTKKYKAKRDKIYFKDDQNIIMEVKAQGVMPLWLVQKMSELKVYPQQFSKIGKIYERIIKEQNV